MTTVADRTEILNYLKKHRTWVECESSLINLMVDGKILDYKRTDRRVEVIIDGITQAQVFTLPFEPPTPPEPTPDEAQKSPLSPGDLQATPKPPKPPASPRGRRKKPPKPTLNGKPGAIQAPEPPPVVVLGASINGHQVDYETHVGKIVNHAYRCINDGKNIAETIESWMKDAKEGYQ